MSFIKKHILLIMITGIFITLSGALLLVPFTFTSVATSSVCYEVPDDIASRITSHETGVTYELSDLKTEDNIAYPKQTPMIPVNYAAGGSIVMPQTSLYLVHEGKLTRGSHITLEFDLLQSATGLYHYFLVNEDGIVDSFATTMPAPYNLNFRIKTTGNYAIILYVEEALGDYKLNYSITRSLLPF